MNTNVFKIDFSNQISYISRERERERERAVLLHGHRAEPVIGHRAVRQSSLATEPRCRDGRLARLEFFLHYSNQIIYKNNFVNDLDMYKTRSNFHHWQKNKMPKDCYFEFFNNIQNTQTLSYKQP